MQLVARFALAFATASFLTEINLAASNKSPDHYAKGTQSGLHIPKNVHSPSIACKLSGFRFYFTPLTGVLFTFPSRYLYAIGHQVVLSLTRWSSQIPTGFHVSRSTREIRQKRHVTFRIRGFHPLWPGFPACFARSMLCNSSPGPQTGTTAPTTPMPQRLRA